MSNAQSLESRLLAAKEVAILVGDLITKEPFDRNQASFKGKSDIVTRMDVLSEQYIKAYLHERFPQDDFVGEEMGLESYGNCGRWIIDPIDGTSNYIHNIPGFTISIAYEIEPFSPLIGVVYSPCHKELYYALKGKGAFCNEERISASHISTVREALSIISPPLRKLYHLPSYLEMMKVICEETGDTRDFGSAALHFCYLASGKADGFFEYGLKYHDVAAGFVLLQEAGGLYCFFEEDADTLFSSNIIATNRELHLWYTTIIRAIDKRYHETMDTKQILS
ncbi:MAG TPA: inositol monophosphatase family protein [Sphaerochaeta sp.]|nr:inositol monophosphatase family protein [Sphaerochaeta sp.]